MNHKNPITCYLPVPDGPDSTVGVEFGESTLQIPETTTRTQWREIGFLLARASRASTRWVAAWRRFGLSKFGEAVVEHESGQLQFPQLVEAQAKQLSLLPLPVFDSMISPQHAKVLFEELGENPVSMESWARKAIEENLTAGELRVSIDAGKVIRNSEESPVTMKAISSPYVVRSYFDKWAAATLKERPLEEWSVEDLKVLLDEFRPIWICTEKAAALWKMKRGIAPAEASIN